MKTRSATIAGTVQIEGEIRMGLAKLVVDVQSLATMLLAKSTEATLKLSNTEDLPSDSKIIDIALASLGHELVITLSHETLPEPTGVMGTDLSILESYVEVETFETTPDQQLRLDRYEVELRNMVHLQSIAAQLTLPQFNSELTKLTTRVLAVLRHEDPDVVLKTSGVSPLFTNVVADAKESADEPASNKPG